jgi:hypothetical protein
MPHPLAIASAGVVRVRCRDDVRARARVLVGRLELVPRRRATASGWPSRVLAELYRDGRPWPPTEPVDHDRNVCRGFDWRDRERGTDRGGTGRSQLRRVSRSPASPIGFPRGSPDSSTWTRSSSKAGGTRFRAIHPPRRRPGSEPPRRPRTGWLSQPRRLLCPTCGDSVTRATPTTIGSFEGCRHTRCGHTQPL